MTGITRADSDNPLPEGVIPAKVDYSDESTIVEALKGQQFFIITMNVRADPGVHKKLVDAAAKAGVPYVMPNAYGSDPLDTKLTEEIMLGKTFSKSEDREFLQVGPRSSALMPFCDAANSPFQPRSATSAKRWESAPGSPWHADSGTNSA